jgi:acetamidase/formamidase
MSGTVHTLDAGQVHYEWNNALAPRLTIDPGDTVVFDTRDASDRYFSRKSVHADVLARGPFRGHPLTGPVFVRDAAPGDTLIVEVLDVGPALDFGWTAINPGRGLLPEKDFPQPHLQIWDLDGAMAHLDTRVAVPIEAFPGVMGVALDESGGHSTMPPRRSGGNMDIRQLTRGATLFLPVLVPGALFSVGDGHAAQGDGEVCVTAVEMSAQVRLRFDLRRGHAVPEPQLRSPRPPSGEGRHGPWYATTANGPDLYASSQQAIRYMIDHLVRERGLSREEAYIVCSVAVDLKISEIVDTPNWIVSAFLPDSIFV